MALSSKNSCVKIQNMALWRPFVQSWFNSQLCNEKNWNFKIVVKALLSVHSSLVHVHKKYKHLCLRSKFCESGILKFCESVILAQIAKVSVYVRLRVQYNFMQVKIY